MKTERKNILKCPVCGEEVVVTMEGWYCPKCAKLKREIEGDLSNNPKTEEKSPTIDLNKSRIEKIERVGVGYKELPVLDLNIDDIFSNYENNHKKYKIIIKEVLDYYPLATNNDFVLYLEVLRALDLCEVTSGKDNFVFKIKRENIKFLPMPETIRRCRQFLNSKGQCLPTDLRVLELRKRREIVIRNFFAQEKYKKRAEKIK